MEKGLPFVIERVAGTASDKGRPTRPDGRTVESHVGLLGPPATFAVVALEATRHDVLPRRQAALGAWHDMVEVEAAGEMTMPAVLTRIGISNEDVVAAEAHVTPRKSVEPCKKYDPRDADVIAHRADAVVAVDLQAGPVTEVEGLILFVDSPGHALVEQRESVADGGDVNGEIRPVEYQGSSAQKGPVSDPGRHILQDGSSDHTAVKVKTGAPSAL